MSQYFVTAYLSEKTNYTAVFFLIKYIILFQNILHILPDHNVQCLLAIHTMHKVLYKS